MKIVTMRVNSISCAVDHKISRAPEAVGSGSGNPRINENSRRFHESAMAIIDNGTELFRMVQPHAD
jgi:hypothetical protein